MRMQCDPRYGVHRITHHFIPGLELMFILPVKGDAS
jgi:hypothetical protein